jgi:GTP:adenosylcobinamide-phosphate guanylyltransferase/thiamine kinase-like enzyme
MNHLKHIIVQAGGLGSRLETLTLNKPKAMVPIDNLPIIFYLFKLFPDAKFRIIADYKAKVLEKYLNAFAQVDWRVIVPANKGTASGIKEALDDCGDNPLIIIWCDLILSKEFAVPELNQNYIGISKDFECRWSYNKGVIVKEPSREHGIAGLFIFKNKSVIEGVPGEGEFVRWLQTQTIDFQTLDLYGTREIGTMLAYQKNENNKPRCRPFNRMEFSEERVTKSPITPQGEKIAKDEINWYQTIEKYRYPAIPRIYGYEPLQMERIQGDNIFVYNHFTPSQKREILCRIIDRIKQLHALAEPVKASDEDCYDNYIGKTFDRLAKVENLVPFAKDRFIKINGRYLRNVFDLKDQLEKRMKACFPARFHIIHGDITFSNLMLRTEDVEPILIDPRGYFGKTKIYGDADYDWAKLYYSIVGDYDQFNRKKFSLEMTDSAVSLNIIPNGWSDMESLFFQETGASEEKIKLLHAVIWLSLTTYAWEDYDSICGAFYKGIMELNKVL